jgi:hypothetical protein
MSTSGGDDDPWGFLSPRSRNTPRLGEESTAASEDSKPPVGDESTATPAAAPQGAEPPVAAPAAPEGREHRARGELRTTMGGTSLRRRALPMAAALAIVSLAGFLTETVAAAQMLSLAGPSSMLIIYPLGGVGLIAVALVQFRFVDHHARLPMIRVVCLGYAVVFAVALALIVGSVIPIVATGLIWLLADQLNFLVPLLVWSVAGDEFNVAEGRKVFGWIITWTYVGQLAGLAIATFSPALFAGLDVPLWALLAVDPLACLVIAIWLPRALRGSAAARGTARSETLAGSLTSAWQFVNGIPVWRSMLIASVLTFAAGMTIYLGFLSSLDQVIGSDAAEIQAFLGMVLLVCFLVCWIIQVFVAERLQERIGIPGVLLVLPIATVVAGLVLALGAGLDSLALLAIGVALWTIPRWSIDENARRAALSLVPDERRARVSFVIDLGPVAIGLILSGLMAVVGVLLDAYWLVALVAAAFAAAAIVPSIRVIRGWDDSLLSWRLRRRKQNRTVHLGE